MKEILWSHETDFIKIDETGHAEFCMMGGYNINMATDSVWVFLFSVQCQFGNDAITYNFKGTGTNLFFLPIVFVFFIYKETVTWTTFPKWDFVLSCLGLVDECLAGTSTTVVPHERKAWYPSCLINALFVFLVQRTSNESIVETLCLSEHMFHHQMCD